MSGLLVRACHHFLSYFDSARCLVTARGQSGGVTTDHEDHAVTKAPKHLIRTDTLDTADAMHIKHPLNPNSEVFMHRLGDPVGMQRAHLSLARVPPGKESFIPHAHAIQEEYMFILKGRGTAEIDGERFAVGPGDYLGFPTDGAVHHLINSGTDDLVYLMGGERSAVEVARFPSIGKIALTMNDRVQLFDDSASDTLPFTAWVADRE